MNGHYDWSEDFRPIDFAAWLSRKQADFAGRQWLFDQIAAWLAGPGEPLMVIEGEPGIGKSAAAARLVHANPGGQVLAWHFCQAEVARTLEPGRFVRSLAAMLALRLESYASRLEEPGVRESLSRWRCETDPAGAFEEGILVPLAASAAPEAGSGCVLIDALDECLALQTVGCRTTIVDLLAGRVARLPPWVRILVTARSAGPLVGPLRTLDVCRIEAADRRNMDDLRQYVSARLASPPLAQRAGAGRRSCPDMATVLLQKSGGNFLYAKLALAALARGRYGLEELEELPPGLDALYQRFFQKEFPDEASFAPARCLLEAVTAAAEPLAEAELWAAAAVGKPDAAERSDGPEGLKGPEDPGPRQAQAAGPQEKSGFVAGGTQGSALSTECSVPNTRRSLMSSRHSAPATQHSSLSTQHSALSTRYSVLAAGHGPAKEPRDVAMLAKLAELVPPIPQDEGPPRYAVVHKSLADWLASPDRKGAACWIDPRNGHERLAEAGWRQYQQGPRNMSPYALEHLPYHLARAGRWDELEQLLADLAYLESKAEAGLAFRLALDFAAAAGAMPADRPARRLFELLDQSLRRELRFVARHPTALFQCLWNTAWWHDAPEAAAHYEMPPGVSVAAGGAQARSDRRLCDLLQQWRQAKQSASPGVAWVRSLRPPPGSAGGAKQAVLRGHERGVLAVACSSDGAWVCSGSLDQTVRIWDAESGCETLCLRGHEKGVRSVACSPDRQRIASASLDQTVRIWDAADGTELCCLRGHARDVTAVAFSRDGRHVVSGSSDQTVRLWDTQTGDEVRCLRGHHGPVSAVAFSPDGRQIVTGSKDRTVRVWDAETGAQLLCLQGHTADVTCVAWSPDGRTLASGSKDQCVRTWDAATGAELRTIQGHARDVTGVAWSPDGRKLASGSLDYTVRVWDAASGAELRCLRGHARDVTGVAWSPDGRRIASGSWDEAVRLWDAEGTAEVRSLCGHGDWVRCLAWSPDGRQVASGSVDRTVRVWDAQSGVQLFCLAGHGRDVVAAAWSPDGRRLATGSFDETIRVWDTQSGAERLCLRGHRSSVYSVVYSPDGRHIASGSLDQTVRVWDARSGAELHRLHGHDYWVLKVVYSPDGRRIVSAALDQTLRVWDARTGNEMRQLRGHEMDVTCVACSPDGRRIASGSLDQTVRVWDAQRGAELACLRGHARGVTGVAWSSDGCRIASGSFDQTVRLWDAFSGQCLAVIEGQGDVAAIAEQGLGPGWRALSRGPETVIEDAASCTPVAWFPYPLENIATHPAGRAWAGAVASHVHIITLEGA